MKTFIFINSWFLFRSKLSQTSRLIPENFLAAFFIFSFEVDLNFLFLSFLAFASFFGFLVFVGWASRTEYPPVDPKYVQEVKDIHEQFRVLDLVSDPSLFNFVCAPVNLIYKAGLVTPGISEPSFLLLRKYMNFWIKILFIDLKCLTPPVAYSDSGAVPIRPSTPLSQHASVIHHEELRKLALELADTDYKSINLLLEELNTVLDPLARDTLMGCVFSTDELSHYISLPYGTERTNLLRSTVYYYQKLDFYKSLTQFTKMKLYHGIETPGFKEAYNFFFYRYRQIQDLSEFAGSFEKGRIPVKIYRDMFIRNNKSFFQEPSTSILPAIAPFRDSSRSLAFKTEYVYFSPEPGAIIKRTDSVFAHFSGLKQSKHDFDRSLSSVLNEHPELLPDERERAEITSMLKLNSPLEPYEIASWSELLFGFFKSFFRLIKDFF